MFDFAKNKIRRKKREKEIQEQKKHRCFKVAFGLNDNYSKLWEYENYIVFNNYFDLILFINFNRNLIDTIAINPTFSSKKTGLNICKWLVKNNYWLVNRILIYMSDAVSESFEIEDYLKENAPKGISISTVCCNCKS